MKREATQKTTVLLPRDLLQKAMAATGLGLTPTIRQGLEAVAAAAAYERLRRRRGQLRLSIKVDELRED